MDKTKLMDRAVKSINCERISPFLLYVELIISTFIVDRFRDRQLLFLFVLPYRRIVDGDYQGS